MADFPLPFYPVPGNHDRDLDDSLTPYLAQSGAPARHYSFDVQTAHFTMVNSASGDLTRQELDWIDRDLSTTTQQVKFVSLHHPPFDPDGTDHIMHSGNAARSGSSRALMEIAAQDSSVQDASTMAAFSICGLNLVRPTDDGERLPEDIDLVAQRQAPTTRHGFAQDRFVTLQVTFFGDDSWRLGRIKGSDVQKYAGLAGFDNAGRVEDGTGTVGHGHGFAGCRSPPGTQRSGGGAVRTIGSAM
jgi:hypothetical protein